MTTLEPILRKHPFFADLSEDDIGLLTGCAKNVRFAEGEVLAREGEQANEFFLIREGRVGIGIASPRGRRLMIDSRDAGDVVGWSWLFPPHEWQFDVTAVTPLRVLLMDGRCLRNKCELEPRLGYNLMKRFSKVMVERLAATRLQLLDLYAAETASPAAEPSS